MTETSANKIKLNAAVPDAALTNKKTQEALEYMVHLAEASIGQEVLWAIARALKPEGEGCFQEDGAPTEVTVRRMTAIAVAAVTDWMNVAEDEHMLCRDLVNWYWQNSGLDPMG